MFLPVTSCALSRTVGDGPRGSASARAFDPVGTDRKRGCSLGSPPVQIDLTGRTALVTGSTAGIGHAIAVGLAGAGATVVVNGRGRERVDEAVKSVAEAAGAGGRVRGVASDLDGAEGAQALIDAEPDVDVLVNSVAVFAPQPVFEIPDDEWLPSSRRT